MKNKLTLKLIIALLFLNISFAQDSALLEKETSKMYEASMKLDYNQIINFTYPKIFDVVPRDQMVEVIKNIFDNEEFNISFLNITPNFNYQPIKNIDSKKLCVITYNIGMSMNFYEELDDETVELMISSFKTLPNYQDVKFDEEKNSFIIKGQSTMIAVSDELTKNQWKFINYESKNKAMIAKFYLNEDILNKLGL